MFVITKSGDLTHCTSGAPFPRIHSSELLWPPLVAQACVEVKGKILKKIPREIRCYDYVNSPYERVRDAVRKDALTVFQSATKSAAFRAQSVAAELHIDIGAVGVKADINVVVKNVEEKVETIPFPTTILQLEWKAASMPGLFPFMKAELSIYPLTATETQLDFLGHYEPPFGVVGKAMNAVVGYRIAELSIHRFLVEVAEYLRQKLPNKRSGLLIGDAGMGASR